MSLDQALISMFSPSEKRSSAAGAESFNDFFSWFPAAIGNRVTSKNYKSSLKLSGVFNAVEQISNSNAIIPYGVFQKTENGRERLADHPIDKMLSSEPDGASGYLTAYIFKKIATVSVLLRGNALFRIVTSADGNQVLKYIPWDDVRDVRIVEGVLVYIIKGNLVLLADEVLHFKGFTFDGIVGVSVITYAAMQLNLAIEVQAFSATSFENKGVRQGVIETDKVLGSSTIDPSAIKDKIKAGWRSAMAEKSPDRIVVLDDGFKFKPITITPQELQILEMARFGIEDVARWFNIAPHKIKSLQQSTNNNIEQQSLDYVTDTLQPIVTNFEQEKAKKLFTPAEKKAGYFVSGNMNVLLRADMKSRAEFYSKMLQGVYTSNEIRALEDKNKLPGGDELRFPVNMQTQSQIDNKQENE